MLLLHSREGYIDNIRYDLFDKDCVLDVFEGGKKVGEITSKKIMAYIKKCKKAGIKVNTEYANLRRDGTIMNPIRYTPEALAEPKFKPTAVSINEHEVARWEHCKICKKCTVSVINGKKIFGFEFDNGFIIGVFGYKAVINSDFYSEADFTIFGQTEHFNFGPDFSLGIIITGYSEDSMCGQINITRSFPDTQDYQNGQSQTDVIGGFELTKQGSDYKGVHTKTVYDSARFAKELIFK